jgi:glutamyl-tRNA reductase/protoheme ferro-lyase
MRISPRDGGTMPVRAPNGAEGPRGRCAQAALLIESSIGARGESVRADPLRLTLASQAAALQRALPRGWRVLHAVHGDRPSVAEAIQTALDEEVERLVVLPMRPQFSASVTGRVLAEVYRCLGQSGADLHVDVRTWWHDDAGYVDAHANLVHGCAAAHGLDPANCALVFWADIPAHSGGAKDGQRHLTESAELLRGRLGWPADRAATLVHRNGVAGGDGEQSLQAAVVAIDASPGSAVLVCPISRMGSGAALAAELESLLGPYRAADIGPAYVCPAPDATEEFVKALAMLVRRGRRPAGERTGAQTPLMADRSPAEVRASVEREVGTLVMAGVCVGAPLRAAGGGGPVLRHCTTEDLRRFKRPHLETVALLRRLGERGLFRECWIWSTCSRYEVYGWLERGASPERRRAVLEQALGEVLGAGAREHANVLEGPDAWHHAMRTAAGLNSALIGDAEVVEQLGAARSAAGYAGTAGARTAMLIEDITQSVRTLRERTAWGRYAHRYCEIALVRLAPTMGEGLATGRCLVVGGSTTSCSILETLTARFGVDHSRLRLIYRGHRKGALVKRLHTAIGGGPVEVVEEYTEPGVLRAVAASDIVLFAVDQRHAILDGDQLRECRDLVRRPLTLVDFNTFASVQRTEGIAGLRSIDAARIDAEVKAFNADLLGDARLGGAVRDAEAWITGHIIGEGRTVFRTPSECGGDGRAVLGTVGGTCVCTEVAS